MDPEHNVSPSPLLGNEVLQWALWGWNMDHRCWTRKRHRNKFAELKYNFQNLHPLTFQSAVSQVFRGKGLLFLPFFFLPFWILYFCTVIYSVLSLIICTLYFNICTCFGRHLQNLVLSLFIEIWEPYIDPLCCRQRKYWPPPDPRNFFLYLLFMF